MHSDSGSTDVPLSSASDGGKAQNDLRAADLPVKIACSGDAGPPSKGKSESCTCSSECRSGYCVDGVCCTSACGETCKACNLPNALGDCSFIPAGASPLDNSICKPSTPATCGRDGTCDGKGACRLYVADTVCNTGTCDGDGLSGVKTCDGKGVCSGGTSKPCAPYSCDPTSNLCDGTCTTNAQCSAGQQCAVRSCGMKLNGFGCMDDSDCASGHCADGTCCNVACNGACLSCNQTGSVGRCRFIATGLPDPECPAKSPSSCGTTGLCDGSGACALYPETTPCGTNACGGPLLLNTARVCDGKGSCQSAQLVDCSPYLCAAGACNGSCTSDTDCEPGHACVVSGGRGTCGKKKNGQSCGDVSECESAQCVDGVCCESSCQGACRSCALPGSPGRCVDVAAGAPDPRKTCTDNGNVSCGHNGVCDGKGACQLYPPGTECGLASCNQGSFTATPTCNQAGQCVAPPSQTCNPFVCNGTGCFASCTKDADCVAGGFCVAGSCGKKPPGAECSAAGECQSGFCAQGVCCNLACTEACKACNLAATLGLCTAVPDGAPDPQEECIATAQLTCGTTGACSAGACALFAKGLACKPASCAGASAQTPASACDGRGACATPTAVSCGTFVCSSTACLSTCGSDGDCVPPNTCVNSSCGLKPNGAACTIGQQCSSGACTEGVCCNTACGDALAGGLCMSCRVSGKVGTCSPVPDGQSDPKQRCAASEPSAGNCSNDGTCDGRGACRPWSTATGCRQASCSGSAFVPAANCDGAGNCPAASSSDCSPYKCSATSPSCLTTCTSDGDCIAGETCLKTNNRCGNKLANGQACRVNSDCTSSVCSPEGVCCNSVCNGACQSCTLASKVGTCSNIANSGSPRDDTTCVAAPPCGNTGKCNGGGGCQLTAIGVSCGNASCAAPVAGTVNGSPASESLAQIPAPACDGTGSCQAASPETCGAYQCNAATGQCKSACSSSTADCNALAPSSSDDSGGNSCVGTTCQKKPNGDTCGQGFACASGNCVDGICCGSASCDDGLSCTTDACSGAGACSNVIDANSCVINRICYAAGTLDPNNVCQACAPTVSRTAWTPRGAGTVCRAAANTCDVAEVCDGTGAACPSDRLASSSTVCRSAASVCDVAENCTGTSATCPTDGFASPVTVCRASTGTCDVAESCTGTSATCPTDGFASSATVCRASTGTCDVAESCTGTSATCPTDSFASGVMCTPDRGSCVDSHHMVSVSGTCNGSGTCTPGTPALCAAGELCVGGLCSSTCLSDASCDTAAGYGCFGNKCLKRSGQACGTGAECATGNCADGVCCASATCGACMACNLPNGQSVQDGTCRAVSAGNVEPHGGCATTADSTCLTDGKCNGAGACTMWSGTACTPDRSTCVDPTHSVSAAGTCNGSGGCAPGAPVACGTGYLCVAGACSTGCATEASCDTGHGYSCFGVACLKKDGQACSTGTECGSGNCIGDGPAKICCASACSDQSCGTKALCSADGSACQTHQGDSCGAAACSGDSRSSIAAGTCDGARGCVAPAPVACTAGYLCSDGLCASNCQTNAACDTTNGYQCSDSTCKKLIANGQPCSADGDCANGHCLISSGTSLICCAVACTDSACSTKPLCTADGLTCQTHAGDPCGTAGCSADQHGTISPTCDGLGTCSPGASPCTAGYLCVGGAGGTCPTMCSDNSVCDGAAGFTCNTNTSACERI